MTEGHTDSHQVSVEDEGQRIDVVLTKRFQDQSRSRIQQWFDDHLVSVNQVNVKASYRVTANDVIEVRNRQVVIKPQVIPMRGLELRYLYEDEDLIVIDKDAGMSVHSGAGDHGPTIVDALLQAKKTLSHVNIDRPGVVHRLDKDTTGVMICAKNDSAHLHLAKQFEEKTNFREYVMLLDGAMTLAQQSVESYIGRDDHNRLRMKSYTKDEGGKWARTHFTRQATYRHRLSLVSARLETGRTHQIRVHARDIKLPVLGDPLYHRAVDVGHQFDEEIRSAILSLERQMLHARYLGIIHPRTGEKLAFEAKIPKDMLRILDLIRPYQDQ